MIRHIIRVGLIIIAIVILSVLGISPLVKDKAVETHQPSTNILNVQAKESVPSKYEDIEIHTKLEKNRTHRIQLLIPETISETINNEIEKWLKAEKLAFLNETLEETDSPAALKINVTIEQESEHYHRLAFHILQKTEGNIETEQEKVFNIDLKEEKVLSLDDFLDVNEQTLQTIFKQALDSLAQIENITIDDSARQNIYSSPDEWSWFMNQDGLTFIFDGNTITENRNDPIHVEIPLQKLYLHMHDNINQYVQLSDTQKAEIETAIKEEEERILKEKQEKEEREQQKAKEKKQPSNGKYIALTFDDGPDEDVTPRVLEILKQYDAKATFFMLGSQVDYFPEIAKQVADAGHEIGNHTEEHQDLTKLSPEQIRQEISSASDKIANATGKRPYLFRPPYGFYNNDVINDASNHGNSIILWSIDSQDWKSRNPEAINREIQQALTPGAIVLMHDIHPTTADALPELMENLKQQGYQFVTVSQLLEIQGLNGVGPVYGKVK